MRTRITGQVDQREAATPLLPDALPPSRCHRVVLGELMIHFGQLEPRRERCGVGARHWVDPATGYDVRPLVIVVNNQVAGGRCRFCHGVFLHVCDVDGLGGAWWWIRAVMAGSWPLPDGHVFGLQEYRGRLAQVLADHPGPPALLDPLSPSGLGQDG